MGAQQVKEGRGASSCNPINTGLNANIGVNNTNLSAANCTVTNNSVVVGGGSTFGAGSSLRASRINKSRVPKEPKNIALNVFTEHNGKSNHIKPNAHNSQILNRYSYAITYSQGLLNPYVRCY